MNSVDVDAPSRLHFGLYAFGGARPREYGGAGLMIDEPRVRLTAVRSDRLTASGPAADRALDFGARWQQATGERRGAAITIHEAPPQHVGLGVGTALGLAVAAALETLNDRLADDATRLAQLVDRGRRSAVGAHGFVLGGLVAEQGRAESERLGPLQGRAPAPEMWRVVLVRPRGRGLSGAGEQDAFRRLPPVPHEVSDRLRQESQRLLAAAAAADHAGFCDALYRYGCLAGECFLSVQGGPFNGPELAELVERIRGLGHAGVGQSSWGPTLFVVVPDQAAAEQLCADLRRDNDESVLTLQITRPRNEGARIASQ